MKGKSLLYIGLAVIALFILAAQLPSTTTINGQDV